MYFACWKEGQNHYCPVCRSKIFHGSCLNSWKSKYLSIAAMSSCWSGFFSLSFSPLFSLRTLCCMPVSLLPFKGRILPCNPSQLWQIARPIKEKLFGSPQTRWPHVAAGPPFYSAFIPPGTSPLRVQRSWRLWFLPQWIVEENMETADKHDN